MPFPEAQIAAPASVRAGPYSDGIAFPRKARTPACNRNIGRRAFPGRGEGIRNRSHLQCCEAPAQGKRAIAHSARCVSTDTLRVASRKTGGRPPLLLRKFFGRPGRRAKVATYARRQRREERVPAACRFCDR